MSCPFTGLAVLLDQNLGMPGPSITNSVGSKMRLVMGKKCLTRAGTKVTEGDPFGITLMRRGGVWNAT